MDINKAVNEMMVTAAKAQDKIRLSTVRMLKTALHNREIDSKRPLDESEVMQVLTALVKQRKDSIEQFTQGNRMDLAQKEEAELKILQEFMPEQISDEELDGLIQSAISEVCAVSVKDMGKVMKVLMPRITGRADGKAAGEKVKTLLSL